MPQPGSGDTSVSIKITPEAFILLILNKQLQFAFIRKINCEILIIYCNKSFQ